MQAEMVESSPTVQLRRMLTSSNEKVGGVRCVSKVTKKQQVFQLRVPAFPS